MAIGVNWAEVWGPVWKEVWVSTLVEVPDVVGETQAAGTATLEGEGFVVAVSTAYSSTVAAGLIISQDPVGGVEYPAGGTVEIVVSLGEAPVSENKGAGRKRRRRRLIVEIDGREFEVSSPSEALSLLEQAKDVAQAQVAKARAAPVRIARGIQRPRIRTAAPELKQIVAQARKEIVSLYDGLARDVEIAALMAKANEEEEEALIRLLM